MKHKHNRSRQRNRSNDEWFLHLPWWMLLNNKLWLYKEIRFTFFYASFKQTTCSIIRRVRKVMKTEFFLSCVLVYSDWKWNVFYVSWRCQTFHENLKRAKGEKEKKANENKQEKSQCAWRSLKNDCKHETKNFLQSHHQLSCKSFPTKFLLMRSTLFLITLHLILHLFGWHWVDTSMMCETSYQGCAGIFQLIDTKVKNVLCMLGIQFPTNDPCDKYFRLLNIIKPPHFILRRFFESWHFYPTSDIQLRISLSFILDRTWRYVL